MRDDDIRAPKPSQLPSAGVAVLAANRAEGEFQTRVRPQRDDRSLAGRRSVSATNRGPALAIHQ